MHRELLLSNCVRKVVPVQVCRVVILFASFEQAFAFTIQYIYTAFAKSVANASIRVFNAQGIAAAKPCAGARACGHARLVVT